MNREEKTVIINSLADKLQQYAHFYLTDTSELNAEQTAKLRRVCFEKDVKLVVVKNTLFIKALEQVSKADAELMPALKGETSVMFSDTGKAPAKLIKELDVYKRQRQLCRTAVRTAFLLRRQQQHARMGGPDARARHRRTHRLRLPEPTGQHASGDEPGSPFPSMGFPARRCFLRRDVYKRQPIYSAARTAAEIPNTDRSVVRGRGPGLCVPDSVGVTGLAAGTSTGSREHADRS